MKKIFPSTIFSHPELEDASPTEMIAIYEACVNKYPYGRREKKLLKELIKMIWFFNPSMYMIFDSHDSVEALSFQLRNAREFHQDPKKKLIEVLAKTKGDPLKEYPTVFHHMEEDNTESFSILMDFLKKEEDQFPAADDALYIVRTYENFRDVMRGLRKIELLKDKMRSKFPMGRHCEEDVDSLFGEISDTTQENSELQKWLEEWTPAKLVSYLDEYIIGQKTAKITAAMTAYTHMVQLANPEKVHRKSYCLFYGPSGSGKTYIWKKISQILPKCMSMTQVDCSLFSPAGYQGAEISDMLQNVTQGGAKSGIILFDEFDKLCKNDIVMDNKTAGQTQANFLKIMDGGVLNVGRRNIDLSNYLFVFAGAFTDIIHKKRDKPAIGFISEEHEEMEQSQISDEAFIDTYNMLPELLGRIDYKAYCRKLELDDFLSICKLQNGAVEGLKDVYNTLGLELIIEEDAYYEIARYSYETELGARNIQRTLAQAVMEKGYQASCCVNKAEKAIHIDGNDILHYLNA